MALFYRKISCAILIVMCPIKLGGHTRYALLFLFLKSVLLCAVLISFCLVSAPVQGQAFSQAAIMSNCPLGSPEAEEMYQEARRHRYGQDGRRRDIQKAEELFEEAMFLGNSKAPLGIGGLYMWEYSDKYEDKNRLEFMLKMYNTGVKMGCAEGHVLLAECYLNGWGVAINEEKAIKELQQAVSKGSSKGMELLGHYMVWESNRIEEARDLLRQSLNLGNGDAGYSLSISYLGNDDDRMYASLRIGLKLGSIKCLRRLASNYLHGDCGIDEDKELYECVTKIQKSINWFYPPKPIDNFDELCPHPKPLDVTP